MNPRKRPAAEPLLPLHSAKQPRTRMVGYDGGNPSPSEDAGLLSRWKSITKEFGILALATARAIFYRPQQPSLEHSAPQSMLNELYSSSPGRDGNLIDGSVLESEGLTSPPGQKIREVGERDLPHHLSHSPTNPSQLSTPEHASHLPQGHPTPTTSTPYTHFNQVKEAQSSNRQHKYDTIPRNYRNREHIYAKAHKANVRAETRRIREEMQRQIYRVRRNRGYTSNFIDFQSLLAFQEKLELLEQRDGLSQASHQGHPCFNNDDMEFLRRAFDRARATLNEPRPPRPFQPTFEQLKLSQRRKDRDIEQLLRPKPAPPTPLPSKDDAQVDALLKKRGTIAKFAREQVNDQDLSRLRPSQWLNDEIINFYGALILARSDDCKENPPGVGTKGRKPLNVHYFSTFFWTKLKEGYEKGRLAKWTKKVDIFTKDVVLIPVNHSNAHWTSAAINFRRKRIESYDSMGTRRDIVFKLLRSYLDAEHRNKKKVPFDFAGWEDYSLEEPLQENGYDCGVFTCQFLQGLSRGDEVVRFTQQDMHFLRRRMIWEIGNATLRDDP